MKRISLFILSICIVTTGIAQTDTSSVFSLDQAIAYALENNRTVKNANRDVQAAVKQKWETTAKGLPQVNAAVSYNRWLKQQVSLFPPAFLDQYAQIRQLDQFYDMTSLPVVKAIPDPPTEFAEVTFGTKQTMDANATLNQLIFDGSYIVGLQSAKVFLQISENAKQKTDLEVKKAVTEAYGNVLLAKESVQILEKNVAVLSKNLTETREIYKNGLAEEESVEQLQITLSGLQSTLNYTKHLENLSYQMLNVLMGRDIYATMTVSDDLEVLTKESIQPDLMEVEAKVENNIDYLIAKNSLASKELLLKLEKTKYLPSVNAFLNGGFNANSDEFTFTNSDQKWFGYALIGVNMNIPIFSSFDRKAATQRAKINLDKAQEDVLEIEQQLKLKVEAAKSDYQLAVEDYGIKKQNLSLAERIEKKNRTKFKEGVSSSFDLRQAQTQLYTAQQEYLQSMQQIIKKKIALQTLLNKQ